VSKVIIAAKFVSQIKVITQAKVFSNGDARNMFWRDNIAVSRVTKLAAHPHRFCKKWQTISTPMILKYESNK
jgi:hypothetical protein